MQIFSEGVYVGIHYCQQLLIYCLTYPGFLDHIVRLRYLMAPGER